MFLKECSSKFRKVNITHGVILKKRSNDSFKNK